MNRKRLEPAVLRRGKRFHKLIQAEWLATAEGSLHPERTVDQTDGRRGRVDILVDEIGDDLLSVVEVKSTDWDNVRDANVRRNVRRQIRQVWRYVDSQLAMRNMSVCAGVIFPRLPRDPARTELVESMFEEEGIQVVWHNESIGEVRERMRRKARDIQTGRTDTRDGSSC